MTERTAMQDRVEDFIRLFPLPHVFTSGTFENYADALKSWADSRNFEFPACYKDSVVISRFQDALWIRAYIRTQLLRRGEEKKRSDGVVHKHAQRYCSDQTRTAVLTAQESFRQHAAETEMISSSGQRLSLLDLINSGTANPANRRAELMVRTKGLERIAGGRSMSALFLTMTVPGPMHATRHTGRFNKQYDGSTVRDCQKHLMKQWILLRARLAKACVPYFGVRVAEPHHDGTPHWHMLLWVAKEHQDTLLDHFKDVAVMGSLDSRGAFAQKHRYKIVYIDPAKGSAVGYIAKYISKNIDGLHTGEQHSAGSVRAWASRHGIRQFQFFGAVSAQLWREARRIPEEILGNLALIRNTARASDYAGFSALASGLDLIREPATEGRFGQKVYGKVLGLSHGLEEAAQTRFQRWAVAGVGIQRPQGVAWTRINNCNHEIQNIEIEQEDYQEIFTDSSDLDKEALFYADETEYNAYMSNKDNESEFLSHYDENNASNNDLNVLRISKDSIEIQFN